jgi:hypothetical protein
MIGDPVVLDRLFDGLLGIRGLNRADFDCGAATFLNKFLSGTV